MILIFKNGTKVEVSNKIADTLGKRITEGCAEYQVFHDNGSVEMIINLSELLIIKQK